MFSFLSDAVSITVCQLHQLLLLLCFSRTRCIINFSVSSNAFRESTRAVCFFHQWSLVWGLRSRLTHSPGPLFPPTPPSHSAPAVPQRGRQRSPGPEPPAGHTHTHTHHQHGPTALELWLSFPSPTQKHKHTHTHTVPTHIRYPHWFLEHLFNDVMCLTSEGSRGRANTWECVGRTCCLCVFVFESCCQIPFFYIRYSKCFMYICTVGCCKYRAFKQLSSGGCSYF